MTETALHHSFLSGVPVPFSPAAIEKELAALWEESTKGGDAEPAHKRITRITLGNVMWLGPSAEIARARATLNGIVSRYPCRLILLEYAPDLEGAAFESFVNAQCFLPVAGREQVCCEEIHFRFGPAGLGHLRGCVLPLLLPDVTTTLWYAAPHPEWSRALDTLIEFCDRTITESSGLDEPATGLAEMAAGRIGAIDLAWYRLAPLREAIASSFDDPRTARMLGDISGLRFVLHGKSGDRRAIVNASIVAGWMASRLGWKAPDKPRRPFAYDAGGAPVAIEMEQGGDQPGPSGITTVDIKCRTGEELTLDLVGSGLVERRVHGDKFHAGARVLRASERTDADAVGAACNLRTSPALFRESARLAAPLAATMLQDGK